MKDNCNVGIITYHYVRDLKYSRYPQIKGLDITFFREQIEYLTTHCRIITMEMLIDAIENNNPLPEKSVLLTFDDAYIDHYQYVFPILSEFKIQGSFYPPVKAITEHTILDVNKIHFILAAEEDKTKIINEIYKELSKYRGDFNLQSDQYYYLRLAKPNRFDTADVIFIKRLLQVELEETLRKIITKNLFEKIVGINEESFSRELYMNIDQIKCMHRNGMHIGSHGYDHFWLGSLSKEKQRNEIDKSLEFLKTIGCEMQNWTMSYPYGNYNNDTVELLQEYNCKMAFTTEVDLADLKSNNRHYLPRFDTNDIPKDRNTHVDTWYHNALS
jgi:peptidoglycan/xylan/chitin deacetylase (PgdA/CDA1 family)